MVAERVKVGVAMSFKLGLAAALGVILAGSVSAATLPAAKPTKAEVAAAVKAARANPDDPAAMDGLLRVLPKVTVMQNGAPYSYYVYEGDILATKEFVVALVRESAQDEIERQAQKTIPKAQQQSNLELVVLRVAGKKIYWPKGQRDLTYAIDKASFPTTARYNETKAAFAKAAKAWVDACPSCGVSFTHKPGLDAAPVIGTVTFVVRYTPDATDYVARAFFPNDLGVKREVSIAPSYFTEVEVDRTGILRHEIGHILGYRHEHITGEAGCVELEDNLWERITDYDPESVMHYLCNGKGSAKLDITKEDAKGHLKVYS